MFRCLNDGCPWHCGSRGNAACAERFLAIVMGVGLVMFLAATVVWGIVSGVAQNAGLEDLQTAVEMSEGT